MNTVILQAWNAGYWLPKRKALHIRHWVEKQSWHGSPQRAVVFVSFMLSENSLYLITIKQTYVSVWHQVPVTAVIWVLLYWPATKAVCVVCSQALSVPVHQGNEFALVKVVWALLEGFYLEEPVRPGKCRSWSHQKMAPYVMECFIVLKDSCAVLLLDLNLTIGSLVCQIIKGTKSLSPSK